MKSLFFYILFLIPVFAISQNDYLLFPKENAVWTTLRFKIDTRLPPIEKTDTITIHYGIVGDTIINGLVYKKVYSSRARTFDPNSSTNDYAGAIREENKIITQPSKYYSDGIDTLYNFNLKVGEVFKKLRDDVNQPYLLYLYSMDSIQLDNGDFRRRFNIAIKPENENSLDYVDIIYRWVEGVGDIQHGVLSQECFNESNPYCLDVMICYQESQNLLYHVNPFKDCFYESTPDTSELYPYQPMAVEGAHWIVASQRSGGLWLDWKVSLTMRGDTIVNGKKYKKLFEEAFYFDNVRKVHTNQIVGSNLYALLRDDTLSRKVYCIHINPTNETLPCPANEEVLLFDFSVEEGDTLDWCSLNWQNHYPTVDSIRFEAFDWTPGIQRKTLYTKLLWSIYGDLGTNTVAITEGIGYDIIGPFLRGSYLLDYCIGTDAQCGILTATKNIPLQDAFNIYPNPSNAYITIEKADHTFENGSIIYLTDQFGRLILQKYYNNTSQERIDITNLPNGTYFLEVVDQDHVMKYQQKVIKAGIR